MRRSPFRLTKKASPGFGAYGNLSRSCSIITDSRSYNKLLSSFAYSLPARIQIPACRKQGSKCSLLTLFPLFPFPSLLLTPYLLPLASYSLLLTPYFFFSLFPCHFSLFLCYSAKKWHFLGLDWCKISICGDILETRILEEFWRFATQEKGVLWWTLPSTSRTVNCSYGKCQEML